MALTLEKKTRVSYSSTKLEYLVSIDLIRLMRSRATVARETENDHTLARNNIVGYLRLRYLNTNNFHQITILQVGFSDFRVGSLFISVDLELRVGYCLRSFAFGRSIAVDVGKTGSL